jgi:hypothetical protein
VWAPAPRPPPPGGGRGPPGGGGGGGAGRATKALAQMALGYLDPAECALQAKRRGKDVRRSVPVSKWRQGAAGGATHSSPALVVAQFTLRTKQDPFSQTRSGVIFTDYWLINRTDIELKLQARPSALRV